MHNIIDLFCNTIDTCTTDLIILISNGSKIDLESKVHMSPQKTITKIAINSILILKFLITMDYVDFFSNFQFLGERE